MDGELRTVRGGSLGWDRDLWLPASAGTVPLRDESRIFGAPTFSSAVATQERN
jgi:hypothetical protein